MDERHEMYPSWNMEYIRKYYGVPAKRGAKIKFRGFSGVITGSKGAYLKIKLDKDNGPILCHPTWGMEYMPSESTERMEVSDND